MKQLMSHPKELELSPEDAVKPLCKESGKFHDITECSCHRKAL